MELNLKEKKKERDYWIQYPDQATEDSLILHRGLPKSLIDSQVFCRMKEKYCFTCPHEVHLWRDQFVGAGVYVVILYDPLVSSYRAYVGQMKSLQVRWNTSCYTTQYSHFPAINAAMQLPMQLPTSTLKADTAIAAAIVHRGLQSTAQQKFNTGVWLFIVEEATENLDVREKEWINIIAGPNKEYSLLLNEDLS